MNGMRCKGDKTKSHCSRSTSAAFLVTADKFTMIQFQSTFQELVLTATSFNSSIFSFSDGFVILPLQNRSESCLLNRVPTIKNPPDAPSNRGRRGWCTLVHVSTRGEGGKSDGKKSLVEICLLLGFALLCYNHILLSPHGSKGWEFWVVKMALGTPKLEN